MLSKSTIPDSPPQTSTKFLPPQKKGSRTLIKSLKQAAFPQFSFGISFLTFSLYFLFLCFIPSCEGSPFRPHQSPLHCFSQIFLSYSPPSARWLRKGMITQSSPSLSQPLWRSFPFLTKALYNFTLNMSRLIFCSYNRGLPGRRNAIFSF